MVDEAHLLDADQLEELRLLTNADMDSRSPFACLLVGQPTLRRRIKLGEFAALDLGIPVGRTLRIGGVRVQEQEQGCPGAADHQPPKPPTNGSNG